MWDSNPREIDLKSIALDHSANLTSCKETSILFSSNKMTHSIKEVDLRFQSYCRILLAGPAGCGKTNWCYSLLQYLPQMFTIKPKKIFYYYQTWQPLFEKMRDQGLVNQFIQDTPTMEDVEEWSIYENEGGTLAIIDDQIQHLSSDLAEIFQVGSRHNGVNLILMTQNLFSRNKYFRDISLNANYVCIFKNPRDSSIISHFGKQFSPGNPAFIKDIYKHATKNPYGYLLCDFDQKTPNDLRLRSNIFPNEHPVTIYTERKNIR